MSKNILIPVEEIDFKKLYKDESGVETTLAKVRAIAEEQAHDDVSSDAARKEIASVAAKVASTKVALDGVGKNAVAEIKNRIKEIDGKRKLIRDELDELKGRIREPLTEWEIQKEDIEKQIRKISEWPAEFEGKPSAAIGRAVKTLGMMCGDYPTSYQSKHFPELAKQFSEQVQNVDARLRKMLDEAETKEKEEREIREESERLRRENEELKKKMEAQQPDPDADKKPESKPDLPASKEIPTMEFDVISHAGRETTFWTQVAITVKDYPEVEQCDCGSEQEFADYMRSCLREWFDGDNIDVTTKRR